MSRRFCHGKPTIRDLRYTVATILDLLSSGVTIEEILADYEDLEFDTVSGDAEFLPGVSFIQTPGHTSGSMSMRVDLADSGTMIFTADAIYRGESYGPSAVPASIVNNLEEWFASVEKLRGIAEESEATLVFGHDPEQSTMLRTAPDGTYT